MNNILTSYDRSCNISRFPFSKACTPLSPFHGSESSHGLYSGPFGPPSANGSKRSHMRRVHFPLRSLTPLRRVESKGRAWAAYKLGLPSSRNVSTKLESPRIIFSGIQPTGIPHVRVFSQTRSSLCHVDDGISSGTTLGRLRTGSSCSLLQRPETSSFSPSLAGMPSHYPRIPHSSQRHGKP
jgi:hypothetical protein